MRMNSIVWQLGRDSQPANITDFPHPPNFAVAQIDLSESMTRAEKRATSGLAAIFGLRMLGMFLILPVFALYAEHLPGGNSHTLVGLALGMYGLTQAIFMLPFGMMSDRIGRKKVIIFGLIVFALGSFVAATATDIYWTIFGRALQGAGAVSAAVTAMLADLTREEHRTKAMAIIGSSIGVTFAVSLVAGPALNRVIGVPGIFALTGILALAAIWVVKVWVPDPTNSHFHADAQANPARLKDVLRNGQLLRLDFGIFALHAAQMAMFVVVPVALKNSGLAADHHWAVYLPVLVDGARHHLWRKARPDEAGVHRRGGADAVGPDGIGGGHRLLLGHCLGAVFLFRRVQSARSQPAFADFQAGSGVGQGHRNGRIQHRAGAGFVFRRRGRRLAGPALWFPRGVHLLRRVDGDLAAGYAIHDAASCDQDPDV